MKIIADVQPRTYEVTYLLPDSFTDAERSQIDEEIASTIQKKFKGQIESSEDWGKKRMAYAIKHNNASQTQAYYTHLLVELDPEQAPQLERALQLHAQVMRHLVVKTDTIKTETASSTETETA